MFLIRIHNILQISIISIFVSILILSTVTFAEEIGSGANPVDANQPVTIFSDSAEFDDKTGMIIHYDNVIMDQGRRHLTSDTLIIERDKQGKIGLMTAIGKPAKFHIQPDPEKPLSHGKANIVKYYPKEEKIILLNEAELIQKENIVRSPYLTYFLNTRTLSAEPGLDRRTTIILPKEKNHEIK